MANRLFINAARNGYAPEQCGRTMTVGELIEFLQNFDEEAEVFIKNDNGYTYGNIVDYRFEEEDDTEEDEEDDYYA